MILLALPAPALSAPVGGCKTDADCDEGLACVGGMCEEPFECVDDGGCGAGMQCADGICEEAIQCTADVDCASGQICDQSMCIPPYCTAETACANDAPCVSGRCGSAKRPAWRDACGASDDIDAPAAMRIGPLRFSYGESAIITGEHQGMIEIGGCLAALVASKAVSEVKIIGHTDEQSSAGFNLALGKRRAAAVRDALVRKHPELDGVVVVRSQGETTPLCTQSTESCWRRNRRALRSSHTRKRAAEWTSRRTCGWRPMVVAVPPI